MYPSKRSSISSNKHHSSTASIDLDPILDVERIQKHFQYLQLSLKTHINQKKYNFQENELKQYVKIIKTIKLHYKNYHQNIESTLSSLKNENQSLKQVSKSSQQTVKNDFQAQIQQKQTNFNQRILSLTNQFSRKQLAYKEVIQKLMQNLSSAKKLHQSMQTKINKQMGDVQKVLQKIIYSHKKGQNIVKTIKQIAQQIHLRQQNSLISQKSDDLSLDQLQSPPRPSQIMLSRICDEQSNIGIGMDVRQNNLQKQLQDCLIRLVCFGLFAKQNQDCLNRMINHTVSYRHPAELLDQTIFPIIVEMLINNMKQYQEEALKYFQGIEESEEGSRLELRNINNLSDLSIGESQIQEFKFKKGKIV